MPEDTQVTFDPTANDNDSDGDALSVTAINGVPVSPGDVVELPSGGTVTVNTDGTLTFMPAPDGNGSETFTYTATDGEGGESTATVTLDVTPVQDAPRVTADPAGDQISDEGDDVLVDLSGSFFDPDGDDITFTATGLPPGLTIDPTTGVVSGEPSPGSSQGGPYTVIVTATDSNGNEVTLEFVWIVNAGGADVQTLLSFGDAPNWNDAGNMRSPYAFSRAGIDAPGAVISAANSIRSLNGIAPLGVDRAVLSAVNAAKMLGGVDQPRGFDSELFSRVNGAEGFSSRTDVAGTQSRDPSTQIGQFVIESFIRDRVLYVEVYDTIDREKSRGFREFQAKLGDGRALPSWISASPDGLFVIERPAHVETVTLMITGLLEGGGSVIRTVQIDTPTGEIRDHQSANHAFGMSFSAALDQLSSDDNKHEQSVNEILQNVEQ